MKNLCFVLLEKRLKVNSARASVSARPTLTEIPVGDGGKPHRVSPMQGETTSVNSINEREIGATRRHSSSTGDMSDVCGAYRRRPSSTGYMSDVWGDKPALTSALVH